MKIVPSNKIDYQIFIGLNDSQINEKVIKEQEIIEMINDFFTRKKIDFSLLKATGGYLYQNGEYIIENVLCINIIDNKQIDILKLTQSLSMFMNQENVLVMRNNTMVKMG